MYVKAWRKDLGLLLQKFQSWRANTRFYFLKVFIFFVIIDDIYRARSYKYYNSVNFGTAIIL